MEDTARISFLGDITCDRPMLRALENRNYDFKPSFEKVKELWADSQLVIGNLETVFAGADEGYNPRAYTYNAPDSLAEALKNAGINCVTTANNHCLDMGAPGVRRTIDILDEAGILHTGTVRKYDAPDTERYIVKEINGIKVAIVSLTYAMNSTGVRQDITMHICDNTNLLRQFSKTPVYGKSFISRLMPVNTVNTIYKYYRKALHKPIVNCVADEFNMSGYTKERLKRAFHILELARKNSDFVVCCIHSGGQFNTVPGKHSVQLFEALAPYCDAIIGNHAHVMQKMEMSKDGKLFAYSLGGMNMSSSSDYIKHTVPYEYSACLTVDLKRNENGKVVIADKNVKLIRAKEDSEHYVYMYPATIEDADYKFRYEQAMSYIRF